MYSPEKPEPEAVPTETGELASKLKITLVRPHDAEGNERDQSNEAAEHMELAAALGLPRLTMQPMLPEGHRAVIVGGGPSIESELENIRLLSFDPRNMIFALNWAHTWLLQKGIVPDACVMFEIDVDPCQILEAAHEHVTYYICSHCHPLTFEGLKGSRCVLWHSTPNSDQEKIVFEKLYSKDIALGGGISTFLRTLSIALALGYRNFELFGVDSSFPEGSKSTHVGGYPTIVDAVADAFPIYARDDKSGVVKKFMTVSYLAHQVEEFKQYCLMNHQLYKMHVHGDTLLAFVHRCMWAGQYEVEDGITVP